jgi:hypothetical protein
MTKQLSIKFAVHDLVFMQKTIDITYLDRCKNPNMFPIHQTRGSLKDEIFKYVIYENQDFLNLHSQTYEINGNTYKRFLISETINNYLDNKAEEYKLKNKYIDKDELLAEINLIKKPNIRIIYSVITDGSETDLFTYDINTPKNSQIFTFRKLDSKEFEYLVDDYVSNLEKLIIDEHKRYELDNYEIYNQLQLTEDYSKSHRRIGRLSSEDRSRFLNSITLKKLVVDKDREVFYNLTKNSRFQHEEAI